MDGMHSETSTTQHLPARPWRAKWIGYPDVNMVDWRRPVIPAPVFRKSFTLDAPVASPVWRISGLGFFFLEVDGRRVSDNMLQPAPTQYDRRWRYRVFRTEPLAAGRHTISVTVGNGLYFTSTRDVWHFNKADWQDYPKMICELTDGEEGTPLLLSDSTWSVCPGPISFNTLRGGETYDARRELPPAGEEPAPVKARSIVEIWPPPDWKKERVYEGRQECLPHTSLRHHQRLHL